MDGLLLLRRLTIPMQLLHITYILMARRPAHHTAQVPVRLATPSAAKHKYEHFDCTSG